MGPAVQDPVYRVDRVAQDPADPEPLGPGDLGNRAIRVAPGDMNRVVGTPATADTGQADTSRVDQAVMTPAAREVPADLVDPASRAGTTLGAMILASPADMIPTATTRADLARRGRRAGPQDRTGLLPVRRPAVLDLTRPGRPTPVDRRRVRTIRAAAPQAAPTRGPQARRGQAIPVAATRRVEVIPVVAATRQAEVAPVAAATRRN